MRHTPCAAVSVHVDACDALAAVRPQLAVAGFRLADRLERPDIAVLCAPDPGATGWLDALRRLRQDDSHLPVVLLALRGAESLAVTALRAGVNDYFAQPFPADDLIASIRRLANGRGTDAHEATSVARTLIGDSLPMREIRDYVGRIAACDANVLIFGETGTGKELVAELIHRLSGRRHRPFVAINCAAIPEGLLESELFGYERGAFTGAHAAHEGHLAAARGGTVFLDEVGDMSAPLQSKLLRVLDAREVYRLGGTRRVPLDIRVVAATNRDLRDMVRVGQFRTDLYYRLHVASVELPPLRARRDDIPALVTHYLDTLGRGFNRRLECVAPAVLDALMAYDWPGNVRELKNLLESLFTEMPPGAVTVTELPPRLLARLHAAAPVAPDERGRLLAALRATRWNKSRAAHDLNWSRMTLYRKMARYGVAGRPCATGHTD